MFAVGGLELLSAQVRFPMKEIIIGVSFGLMFIDSISNERDKILELALY